MSQIDTAAIIAEAANLKAEILKQYRPTLAKRFSDAAAKIAAKIAGKPDGR